MPAYFGSKQLFRNRNGGKSTREIYFGNKMIMGFNSADYSVDEIVKEKAPAGDYPQVTGTGSAISVGTVNYNPGYGFTKYYCDHIKIDMFYSGGLVVYDCEGNTKVEITGTFSFSFLTAKFTIGSKCIINGSTVFDESYSGNSTPANKLTYEVYFDTANRKWTVVFDGRTFTGGAEEWKPCYARVLCQMWMIPGYQDISFYNGAIHIQYMNRGRGYPNAK